MNDDILQVSTAVVSVISPFRQVLCIGGHTHSGVTKVFPPPVSSIDTFACPVHLYQQIKDVLHTVTETKSGLCRKVN
jgi:hypothetical protein